MNVIGKISYLFFFVFAFSLGCEQPNVQVSSLGKKLPAPALKGESPFSQNFDNQGYARILGSCDSRVGDVFVSFDNVNWVKPTASPDITGTTLTAGTANDISCADGVFDVYVTENDIMNIWQFNPAAKSGISIYIKGETLIGDTETLVLNEPAKAPAKLILEKTWPRGFAGSDSCETFNVNIVDNKGNRINATSDISFEIQNLDSNAAITGYANRSDCNTGASPLTSFKIAANTDHVELFYRFPASPINQTLSYQIVNPSSLTADSNATQIMLRDSTSYAYQWLSIENFSHQLYKDACYPLTIRSHKYNHMLSYEHGTFTVSSTSANFRFFSGSDCLDSEESTSFSIQSIDSSATVYVKYTPSAGSTNSFESANMSISGSSYTSAAYDFSPINFKIDLSINNIATQFEIWGPSNITVSSCQKYHILTFNTNHSWIPVNSNTQINLNTSENGVGNFYPENTCGSAASPASAVTINSLTIPGNSSKQEFYFKPISGTSNTYHFDITATGFRQLIYSWFLQPLSI